MPRLLQLHSCLFACLSTSTEAEEVEEDGGREAFGGVGRARMRFRQEPSQRLPLLLMGVAMGALVRGGGGGGAPSKI